MRRTDRGAGIGLGACVAVVVLAGAGLGVLGLDVVAASQQARHTADLAALAGAQALLAGTGGCATAERVAVVNGGRVASCAIAGTALTVRVGVSLGIVVPRLPAEAFARATADRVP